MSDLNRNYGSASYAGTAADAVAIDQGLRAYMLQIYNYMVLGLAITGFAALGIYMLSVTGDAAAAAKVLRNGAQTAVALKSGVYLTPIGYAMFASPLKWVVILAPLGLVFALSFGIERMRPAMAQMLFWLYAALVGLSLGSIFLVYTHTSDRKSVV